MALLWTLENGLRRKPGHRGGRPRLGQQVYGLLSGIMRRAQQVAAFELARTAA